jgi:DNA-binding NarL/FixJ family response regulator
MPDRVGRPIRVSIVEDQRQTREGLAALLSGTDGFGVIGSFSSMEEALRGLPCEWPDAVLLDIRLPGMSGIDGVRRLRELRPGLPVLMLTVYGDDEHVFEAICAGARGYLLKDTPPARLLESIREAAGGGAPMSPEIARKVVETFRKVAPPENSQHRLSPRELQILKLLSEGHSYKTAARELAVSLDTIRFHVRNIYDKLHVHSKSEAVVKALRSGLLR